MPASRTPKPVPSEVLRRATGYPYERLGRSFLMSKGEALPLTDFKPGSVPHRSPLIAYGANASFEGLRRKLAGLSGDDSLLPVLAGRLADTDIAFSPHLTTYGSVPATLTHAPGVSAEVTMLWVTHEQQERIAATEPNYRFGRLENASFQSPEHVHQGGAFAFGSRHGILEIGGSRPVLSAVAAEGRDAGQQELTQEQALTIVANLLGFDSREELVFRVVEDYGWAVNQFPALRAHSAEFEHPSWSEV